MPDAPNDSTSQTGSQDGNTGKPDSGDTSAADESKSITLTSEQLAERLERAKRSAKPADYDELVEKARQFDEAAEAQKSEATKATERIAALEAELANSKASVLRAEAAAEADVPVSLITASTEEEIKAQVKALKEWLGDKKPGGNHVPREGRQTNPPKADDKKAFADFLTGQG